MSCPISKRLLCCAQMVPPGSRVADVGTDHGYLGIHLIQAGISPMVIAADLRQKPLENARQNAAAYGVQKQMQFLLSDGVAQIAPDSFDTLVCAGMGGDCISFILESADFLKNPQYTLLLQPQTSTNDLRRWLSENGFSIREERLVKDGRFLYVILRAQFGEHTVLSPGQQYISPALLSSGDPLLAEYLARIQRNLAATVSGISGSSAPKHQARIQYYTSALEEVEEMRKHL